MESESYVIERDDKELLSEPKEVAVPVDGNPPPYQQHECGLRVYPTKRAYAWLCARGHHPYGQFGNTARTPQRRVSWLACFLLAIPVVMLLALGIYLVMLMFFWCPNCGHHKDHVIKVQSQMPRHEQVAAEVKKPEIIQHQMDAAPELPSFPRRMFESFFPFHHPDPRQAHKPPVVRERHMFFIIRPKPAVMEEEESAKDGGATKKEGEHGLLPLMSGIPSQLLSMATNLMSGFHGFFHISPLMNATEAVEKPEATELQPADDAETEAAPHKTIKIEEGGVQLHDLDEAIDDAVRRRQKENPGEAEAENQKKSDNDDETDPFVFRVGRQGAQVPGLLFGR